VKGQTMHLFEKIKAFPWTQLFLLLLLIVSILNLKETKRLETVIQKNLPDPTVSSLTNDELDTSNAHLAKIEEYVESIDQCNHLVRPLRCR
jgi:hypothetical protein